MKKILLLLMIAFSITFSAEAAECESVITSYIEENDCDSEMDRRPRMKVDVDIVWGIPEQDCRRIWPICYVTFHVIQVEYSTPAQLVVYDDEVVLEIKKVDLIASGNEEAKKKLLNVSSVSFGAAFDVDDNVSRKIDDKLEVSANAEYEVSSTSESIGIHFPIE